MGCVPVHLGLAYNAIWQTNACDTFQFSPTPGPINFPEPGQVTYRLSNGNSFDSRNRPDDFNVHYVIFHWVR